MAAATVLDSALILGGNFLQKVSLNKVTVQHGGGGKSGHRRAGRSLTATGGDPRVRATESRPPLQRGKGETVG